MKSITSIGITTIILLFGCTPKQKNLEVHYLKDGTLYSENIPLNFIGEDHNIRSPYIDSVKFCYLDSLSFKDNNPDRYTAHKTPYELNFSGKIEPYSPEYYTAYSLHHIIKVIEYYNRLFENKIDFNSQKEYKTIEIAFGDVSLLTGPNFYIFSPGSNPSPTLFSHEIGHRAFWYLEDSLGIKFNGLSIIHMGLLEYFTLSLYNTPLVGEDCLPAKTVRNAKLLHKYPPDSSLVIRQTFKLLEDSYPAESRNPHSNISKYLSASYFSYGDDILDKVYDNHRGGMILTGTLWRIREQIGQEKTDKLVAQTILNLNSFMYTRPCFYQSDNNFVRDGIEWYDVYYGLIQKDKELFDGQNTQIIYDEFSKTGYPVALVKH